MRQLSLSYLLQLGALALFPVVGAGSDFMSAGLTPEAVYASLKTEHALRVVDVRKPWEFNIAHIPGAVNIPVTELEQHVDELRNR